MFGSQALDTAIGLTLMMFVLATAASALLELGTRFLKLRSRDLQKALRGFIAEEQPKISTDAGRRVWTTFTRTSVYQAAVAARRGAAPPYLSAKSFAESITELIDSTD